MKRLEYMIILLKKLVVSDETSQIISPLKFIRFLSVALGLSATLMGCGNQVDGRRFRYGLKTYDLLFQSLVVSNIFAFAASSGALTICNKRRGRRVFFLFSLISFLCMSFSFGILICASDLRVLSAMLELLSAIWS